jgi:hypothetical protein
MTALLNPDLEDALWDGDLAYIIRDAVAVAANPEKSPTRAMPTIYIC